VVTKHKTFPIVGTRTYGYTAEVNPSTEVWFDLIPDAAGIASDETTVPFVPVDPDGVMSVVVDVLETNTEFGIPTEISLLAMRARGKPASRCLCPGSFQPAK
jgi:hypothetical protein